MKRFSGVVLTGIAAAVLVLGAQGESMGAPRSDSPQPRPSPTVVSRPALDLQPTITDLDFQGGGSPKLNAPLKPIQLELGLETRGTNPRAGTFSVKNQGVTIAAGQFALGGGDRKTLPFFDPVGLQSACGAANYDVAIQGSGFDIKKKATITPSCQFSSKTENPWNLMSPDRVEDHKNKHVWFNDATVTKVPASNACNAKLTFATVVKNDLTHAVAGIRLDVKLGSAVEASSQPFNLAAGQSKSVSVDMLFHGDAGSYQIDLSNPQNTAGGALSASGYSLDVTRNCSLTAALAP